MASWGFLTNHARVLLCIARDPGTRLRDIAGSLGITERSAHGIVNDLADAGYVGMPNFRAIEKVGANAYIQFRDNNKGEGAELWRKLSHIYMAHRKEFLEHYNLRSNVESVFSSMKRKFGTGVRAKDLDSQINEGLLKALCHNVSVLVQVTNRIGLDPVFWKGSDKFVTAEFAAQ